VGKGEDRLTGAVSLVYGFFAMSVLFGISAWFAEDKDRAGGLVFLAVSSTFGLWWHSWDFISPEKGSWRILDLRVLSFGQD